MEQRDLIIIGGGPAGYVGAIRARQLGARVTLIEKDILGGTCLNRGCIPTRALVRGVEFLGLAKKAKDFGIDLGQAEVNFARMMARKDIIVSTVVGGVELLMKENGVEVVRGEAKFVSPSVVAVRLADGTNQEMTAPKMIIATGASPQRPSIPGGQNIITTDQALEFKEIPRSMVVLGGGAIGLAFATIFARLGASVTIVEESALILPDIDRELVSLLERELRKDKIRVHTEASLKSVEAGGGVEKRITLSARGQEITLTAEHVLVADERRANVDGLSLDKVGVSLRNGAITVDKSMQTSVPGIFAAGDVAGEPMLAHVAFAQGKIAVENALGKGPEMDYAVVPHCIYSSPEIASVGLTEQAALAEGYQIRVGRFPFAANGMATIRAERTGTVKIISEVKYGQILGVHIIGPGAGDLIPEAALAMKLDATPREIAATIHAHPSLAEALMEAALDVSGETVHFMSPNK
jgi:dihydrolipoamide dehydrogenase